VVMTAELAVPESHVDDVRSARRCGTPHAHGRARPRAHELPRTKFIHLDAVGTAVTLVRELKAALAGTGWRLRTDDDEQAADDATAVNVRQLESSMEAMATIVAEFVAIGPHDESGARRDWTKSQTRGVAAAPRGAHLAGPQGVARVTGEPSPLLRRWRGGERLGAEIHDEHQLNAAVVHLAYRAR